MLKLSSAFTLYSPLLQRGWGRVLFFLLFFLLILQSCRHDIIVWPGEEAGAGTARQDNIAGFYLLNEGNMGSNKCTLDYYDYTSATYIRNIYGSANPSAVKELGDVGNDLQVYGSRLWAVVNASNKVEVMDVHSARRLGQVDIPNPRYICFHERYAYISSYAGPMQEGGAQLGMVLKVDTASLQEVARCIVGRQPDGITVLDNRLYVANSGGYIAPAYENTLSVIDLASFTEVERIAVAPNLHRVIADSRGQLWVSARSDYFDQPSQLYRVSNLGAEPRIERIVAPDGTPLVVANMTLKGDSLFVLGDEYSYSTFLTTKNYAIVDIRQGSVLTTNFISDGTEQIIQNAYGIGVNPQTGEILITDAQGYINPGMLLCYSPHGQLQWKVRTGDIPGHVVFVTEK